MSDMKTQEEVQRAADNVAVYSGTKYPSMTYEQGVREALEWVLGDVSDDEFEFVG